MGTLHENMYSRSPLRIRSLQTNSLCFILKRSAFDMECSDSAKVIISMNFDRDIRPRMAGLMSSPENNRLNKLLLEFFLIQNVSQLCISNSFYTQTQPLAQSTNVKHVIMVFIQLVGKILFPKLKLIMNRPRATGKSLIKYTMVYKLYTCVEIKGESRLPLRQHKGITVVEVGHRLTPLGQFDLKQTRTELHVVQCV